MTAKTGYIAKHELDLNSGPSKIGGALVAQ